MLKHFFKNTQILLPNKFRMILMTEKSKLYLNDSFSILGCNHD